MPSGRYIPWSVGATKGFKRAAMKPEVPLVGYSRPRWGSGYARFIADRFDRIASCSGGRLHTEIRPRADLPACGRGGGVAGRLGSLRAGRTRARRKLEQDWARYNATQKSQCAGFAALDRAPSYAELLTCLEMAKQAQELPPDSKADSAASNCQDFFPGGLP